MGTKDNPGKFDCYAKAAPDEPIFVLRANDPIAPMVVRLWAAQYWQGGGDPEKVAEARTCADAMEVWHRTKAHLEDGHQPDECTTGECKNLLIQEEERQRAMRQAREAHEIHLQKVDGCPFCDEEEP